ncbi:MAG: carboxylating nicotinate-nucleotide diphosphorylase [Bacteroidota bacterium]
MIDNGIELIVRRALEEDIGTGDVTTSAILSPEQQLTGHFVARSAGVVAGWEVVECVFHCLDANAHLQPIIADGGNISDGQKIATIEGTAQALLTGERTALNILQRMSGIATRTREFVEAVKGTSATILDTRKTAPGLRLTDKLAVKIGGGKNHRMGLYDVALIKNNHIAAAGGIPHAVGRVRSGVGAARPLEIEVRTIQELREALALKPDRIMLDNMSLTNIREAVVVSENLVPLEVSGNITLENVSAVAATGVPYISVGELTHSVKALDINFTIEVPPRRDSI